MSPNDALVFSVAERRLNRRIDAVEERLANRRVDVEVQLDFEIELPEPPEQSNRGTILGVMAVALSIVALCVAVFT